MGKTIGDLLVELGVDATALSAGLDRSERLFERFGTRLFFMGGRISAGVTAPLVAASAAVAKFGMDFDKAMTESLAIMDGITPQIRTQMEGVAADVARSTKFAADEAAKAFYDLGSAGLSASESMQALPTVARFAQAGVMDLANAGEFLAGATAALGDVMDTSTSKAERMAIVSDVLTEANNRALGTIEDFAKALTNQSAAAMRQYNINLQEGVAVLAAYAEQNVRGEKAGRQFWMMTRDLSRAANTNAEAFKKYGISVFDASGGFNHMADIIEQVEKATAKLNVQQRALMFQQLGLTDRSRAALNMLIGFSGRIRQLEEDLNKAGGATERVANKQMEALSNQFLNLYNRAKLAAIGLFKEFTPVLREYIIPLANTAIDALEGLTDIFGAMPTPLKAAAAAGIAAVAALGPFVFMIGSLSLAWGGLTGIMTTGMAVIGKIGTVMGLASGGSRALAMTTLQLAAAQQAAGKAAYANAIAQGASAGHAMNAAKSARAVVAAQNAVAASAMASATNMGLVARAATFMTNPITLAVGAALALGGALVYLGTRSTEMEKKFDNNAAAFQKQTRNLRDSLNAWDELREKTTRTAEENVKLHKAIDDLAEASGLSREAFLTEAGASDTLIDSLRRQREEKEKLARQNIQDAEKALNAERDKLNILKRDLARIESGAFIKAEEGITAGMPMGSRAGAAWTMQVRRLTNEERSAIRDRAKAAVEEQIRAAEDARARFQALLGPEIGPPDTLMGVPEAVAKGARTATGEVKGLAEAVQRLYDDLFGRGKSEMAVLVATWEKHGREIQGNQRILAEFGEQYIQLRDKTGLVVPEFEAMFRGMKVGFQKSVHELNTWEDVFDKAAADLVENSDKVYMAFQRLDSPGERAMFFKKHESAIKELIPVINQLPPEIQEIVGAYQQWKFASADATRAAAENMAEAHERISDIQNRFIGELEDKQTDLQLFSKNYADREVAGLRRGLGRMKAEHAKQLNEMMKKVMELPMKDQAAANDRLRIAQQASEEIIRTTEREGTLRLAAAAGFSNRFLRNHEDLTNQQILDLIKVRYQWLDLFDTIQDNMMMARSFGNLVSVLGFDELGSSLSGVNAGVEQFFKGVNEIKTAENFQQTMTGIMDAAIGAVQTIQTLMDTVGRGNRMLAGATAGAQVGSFFGPVGAGIGAGLGAIFGAILKDPRWAQTAERLGERFGAHFSEELSKKIEADAEDIFGGNRVAAAINNLDALIAEAGGLNDLNFDEFQSMFRDVFVMIGEGEMSVAQATQVIDKNFQTFADHVLASNQIISRSFTELISLAQQYGVESRAINEFLQSQVGRFGDAMSTILDDIGEPASKLAEKIKGVREELAEMEREGDKGTGEYKKKTEELNRLLAQQAKMGASSRAEAERLAVVMLTTFNAAIANGVSWTEAMRGMGGSIGQVAQLFEDLGIKSTNAGVKQLLIYGDLQNKFPKLLASAEALNQAFLAMSAIPGAITPETFQMMQDEFEKMQQRLLKASTSVGGGMRESLLPLVPMMESILRAAEEYGFVIDADTQKLIDQAKEMGLINEKQLEANEVMAVGFAAIIEALGGQVPEALQNIVDKVNGIGEAGKGVADNLTQDFYDFVNETNPELTKMPDAFRERWLDAWNDMKRQGISNIDSILSHMPEEMRDRLRTMQSQWSDTLEAMERKAESFRIDPITVPYKFSQIGPDITSPGTLTVPGRDVGGIVKQPHLAVVHTNEAIVPISQLFDQMDSMYGGGGPQNVTVVQEGAVKLEFNARTIDSETEYIIREVTPTVLEAIGGNDAPELNSAMERIVRRIVEEKMGIRR